MLAEIGWTSLLAAHLLCVNVASAGPLLCAWLEWREGRGDAAAGRAADWLGKTALALLALGALLGAALVALAWSAGYRELWASRLAHKLQFGAWELVFSAVLIGVYPLLRPLAGAALRLVRGALAILASTNLLYHFPLLFLAAADLRASGDVAGADLRSADFRQFVSQGAIVPLAVHVSLAALASCGVLLLELARQWRGDPARQAEAAELARSAARWALFPTLAQLPVGLWVLTQVGPLAQGRLMGNDPAGTLAFLTSLAAAFWLMHVLAGIAMGDPRPQAPRQALVALVLVVALMTFAHERARLPPSVSQAAAPALRALSLPPLARQP